MSETLLLTAVPPELLLDNKLTKASDVFAYGVLLFELACCRQAWEGMSHTQVLAAVTLDRRRLAFDPHVLPGIVVSPPTLSHTSLCDSSQHCAHSLSAFPMPPSEHRGF